jgi:hypothetical protein
MDPYNQPRLADLRAQLVSARLERQSLTYELHLPLTSPLRKYRATRRYAAVDAELQNIARELEDFIAATKYALAAKNPGRKTFDQNPRL